jgi:acetyl/propionyl-CoA carboxylase alpha subunit
MSERRAPPPNLVFTTSIVANNAEAGGSYLAPMPCRILQIIAKDGSRVKRGSGLLVMESMKTEVKLTARSDGIVKMKCKEGDSVPEGGVLCDVIVDKEE